VTRLLRSLTRLLRGLTRLLRNLTRSLRNPDAAQALTPHYSRGLGLLGMRWPDDIGHRNIMQRYKGVVYFCHARYEGLVLLCNGFHVCGLWQISYGEDMAGLACADAAYKVRLGR
jgi:hypothetical protein